MSKTPEVKTCTDIECRKTGSDDLCYDCGAPMKVGRYVFEAEVRDIDVPDKTLEEELLEILETYLKKAMAYAFDKGLHNDRAPDHDKANAIRDEAKQQILKQFVPKEEVERVKAENVNNGYDVAVLIVTEMLDPTCEIPQRERALLEVLRVLNKPGETIAQLTNNQPNPERESNE